MRVFGLAGWSGSGKTTLVTRLVPALVRRGVSVSTVKHAHHAFDVDQPGKDSWRHRQAGATEVLISSETRWALMHENRGAAEAALDRLLRHMSPVDLVLVEGFKRDSVPKLEIHRPSLGKPLICLGDPGVIAVASDASLAGLP
ncbi:MAG: molybdopterin-guanine dinucleotide biosynthesis protein B, partial [Stellaceae bacterium]